MEKDQKDLKRRWNWGKFTLGIVICPLLGIIYIISGILLSSTLIGMFIGIPLAFGGLRLIFEGPFRVAYSITNRCPFCKEEVSALTHNLFGGFLSKEATIKCRSCGQKLLIEDDEYKKFSP